MSSANFKMVEYFCQNLNGHQIDNFVDSISPDFIFSTPLKSSFSYEQYCAYVAFLSTSIRFEMQNISTDDDENFEVELLFEIVDAEHKFNGQIIATAKTRIEDSLVTNLYLEYSGNHSELEYMEARAVAFFNGSN